MPNPSLTIQPDKARMTLSGKSWDDVSTDSGEGLTIPEIIIDELEDLYPDIEFPDDDTPFIIITTPDITIPELEDLFPDIDFPDDDTPFIIAIDPDTGIPEFIYEDDGELVIIELPGFDPDDYDDLPVLIFDDDGLNIIELDDLDIDSLDLDWEFGVDLSIDDFDFSVDIGFDLIVEDQPDEIRIMHEPKKTTYTVGQHINLAGILLKLYKNGRVWEGPNRLYFNGYVPVSEVDYDPKVAGMNSIQDFIIRTDRCSSFAQNRHFTATATNGAILYINENDEHTMAVTFLSEHSGACGVFNGSTAYANTLVYSDGISTLYKSSEYRYSHNCDEQLNPYYNTYVPLDAKAIEDLLGGVTITWPRYKDRQILSDSFKITVKAKGGGGR